MSGRQSRNWSGLRVRSLRRRQGIDKRIAPSMAAPLAGGDPGVISLKAAQRAECEAAFAEWTRRKKSDD
jgi:hypothetical protein